MRRNKSLRPLCLESLEDRCCPTLVAQFISGSLILSGSPTATQGQSLSITRVPGAPLALQVRDGAATLGTFNVTGDLRLNLTNYNTDINIDLHGTTATNGTLGGSVVATLGRGNASNVSGTNKVS